MAAMENFGDWVQSVVAPVGHALGATYLEQVEGHLEPECVTDAFQARALGPQHHYTMKQAAQSGTAQSHHAMAAARTAVTQLVTKDPCMEPLPWLAKDFHRLQFDQKAFSPPCTVWHLNNREGCQYVAACRMPQEAGQLAEQVWRQPGLRQVLSNDPAQVLAPANTVCAELGPYSRLEYHVVETPRPFEEHLKAVLPDSGDFREVLLLTHREQVDLYLHGMQHQRTVGHLIWMKSALHPDFEEDDEEDAEGESEPEALHATMGLFTTGVTRDHVAGRDQLNVCEDYTRGKVYLRAFLFFNASYNVEDGNQSSCVILGHEDMGSAFDQFARLSHYVAAGTHLSAGVPQELHKMLGRIQQVGASSFMMPPTDTGAPDHSSQVPQRLIVMCRTAPSVQAEYHLQHDGKGGIAEQHGRPFWVEAQPPRGAPGSAKCVYCNSRQNWMVGRAQDMAKDAGWAVSKGFQAGAKLPDANLEWGHYDPSGQWVPHPDLKIYAEDWMDLPGQQQCALQ